MNPYPFYIKVVFKVVGIFFHGILVPIDFKSTNFILDIVRSKHKPAYPVVLVLCNGFLIIFSFVAPDRSFSGEKIFRNSMRVPEYAARSGFLAYSSTGCGQILVIATIYILCSPIFSLVKSILQKPHFFNPIYSTSTPSCIS